MQNASINDLSRFSVLRRLAAAALLLSLSAALQAQPVPTGGERAAPTKPRPASGLQPATGFGQQSGYGQQSGPQATSGLENFPATDPGYRLTNGDEIYIVVYGEGDISTSQRIDTKGIVRIPLIGDINLSNKTVREAENYLEQVFVEKQILRKPMVNVGVRDYSVRQVSILGAVNAPGQFRLPKEAGSIEIVEIITSMGGFRPTAKADDVKVTRVDESGMESSFTVNVESMISGRGAGRNTPKSFLIYPGDRIYVPERLF